MYNRSAQEAEEILGKKEALLAKWKNESLVWHVVVVVLTHLVECVNVYLILQQEAAKRFEYTKQNLQAENTRLTKRNEELNEMLQRALNAQKQMKASNCHGKENILPNETELSEAHERIKEYDSK